MKRFFYIVFIFFLLTNALPGELFYQKGDYDISISPPFFEKMISPKDKISFSIFLQNNGKETVNLIGEVQSLIAKSNNGKVVFADHDIVHHSCQKWIHVDPTNAMIEPNEGQEVKVNIEVPDRIEGGYYAVILFEPRAKNNIELPKNVSLSFALGTTIVLQSRRKQKIDAKIISFGAEDTEDGTLFSVVLSNLGNVHLNPNVSIVLFSDRKRVVDRLTYEEGRFVLPGSERIFRFVWANTRKREHGKNYHAECRFRITGLGRSLRKSISFSVN